MRNVIHKRTESGESRAYEVKRALYIVVFFNIVVAMVKIFYGVTTSSEGMQADGLDSLFDGVGSVVGIFAMSMASRPADKDHPYGHGKFETTASVIIGILLLFGGYRIASTAIADLMAVDYVISVTPMSYILMGAAIAANIAITVYERKMGERYKSEVLSADAEHTFSDVLVSIGVIIGLVLAQLGFPVADSIVTLLVSGVVVLTAIRVLKSSNETLSDKARIPQEQIEQVVNEFGGESVCVCHRVRTRGMPSEVYMDLHVLADPDMSIRDAHELGARISNRIIEKFPQVVDIMVHFEPDTPEERAKVPSEDKTHAEAELK